MTPNSIRAEQAYLDWAKRYILFHGKRHPKDMGEAQIVVRNGKGAKDRVTLLPPDLVQPILGQMAMASQLHGKDLAAGLGMRTLQIR